MSLTKRLILFASILVLAACSTAPGTSATPAPNPTPAGIRQKWLDQNISHYRFTLSVGCFCAFTTIMPVTIEVDHGKVVSMTDKHGDSAAKYQDSLGQYATIDKLFDVIDAAAGASMLQVNYNPQFGYPDGIRIDYNQQVSDDQISFTVSDFEILG